MDKRPTGTRCKGEPSKGRINLRLETTGQKTGEREGIKQCAPRGATTRRSAPVMLTARRAAQGAHRGATARHQTIALRARRCAHSGELQHGAARYSTPATHTPQHGTHGAVRTPRSYNTAQCPGDTYSTARTAQGEHLGATARLGATAEHTATRARSEHTRARGAQDAPA